MNVKHIDTLWPPSKDTPVPVSMYGNVRGLMLWSSTDSEAAFEENHKAGRVPPYGPGDIQYRYNRQGFRCEEFDQLGTFPRMLSVGCSNTEGIGLPERATWSHIAAEHIGAFLGYSELTNLNLGLAGSSNRSIALRAIRAMELFRPFITVIAWTYPSRVLHVYPDGEIADWWSPDHADERSKDPKVLTKLDYFVDVQSDQQDLNNLMYDIRFVELAARQFNTNLCQMFVYLDEPEQGWLRPRVDGVFDTSRPLWQADRARDLLHPGSVHARWVADHATRWVREHWEHFS